MGGRNDNIGKFECAENLICESLVAVLGVAGTDEDSDMKSFVQTDKEYDMFYMPPLPSSYLLI